MPERGVQLEHLYGRYSNAHRGKEKRDGDRVDRLRTPQDALDTDEEWLRSRRASWARMLKQVFQTDPSLCPKCGSTMRVFAFIDDAAVVDRILKHIHYRIEPLHLPSRAPPPQPRPSQLQLSSDWA